VVGGGHAGCGRKGPPVPHPCLPPSGGRRSYNRYYCQLELGLVVDFSLECMHHKVLTYIEYRAVSGVFRTILLTPPLSTQLVCPPPAPKAGGTHSPGGEGVGGQYFGRRQTLDWPLTVKSSTVCIMDQLLLNTHISTGFSII
jgi:hypothetical protein